MTAPLKTWARLLQGVDIHDGAHESVREGSSRVSINIPMLEITYAGKKRVWVMNESPTL